MIRLPCKKIIVLAAIFYGLMLIPKQGRTLEITQYKSLLWEYLETLCDFGPRNPGSTGHLRAREFIKHIGSRFADQVEEQEFIYQPGEGAPVTMVNIELSFAGREAGKPVLLGTHYDTRPYADEEKDRSLHLKPILGANDGGSGTAVLLALAHYFSVNKPRRPVRLVFFDGEDYGYNTGAGRLIGSKHYAEQLESKIREDWPFCVLIVDMVGDRQLEIFRESYSVKSAPWLVNKIFRQAEMLGHRQFKNQIRYSLLDDHIAFSLLGIPSALLIDFDYPHWHKLSDILENCSPESLFAVFEVVANVVGEI